jgi:hypothetical protein
VLIVSRNDLQLSDSGPVTGGVNAQAPNTPVPVSTSPAASATSSKPSSSSTHLVANGLVALLAAVFGITLA